jgi:hypothetical protein
VARLERGDRLRSDTRSATDSIWPDRLTTLASGTDEKPKRFPSAGPREIDHDSNLYATYRQEEARLRDVHGDLEIRRVILEHDLKREYQEFLQDHNRNRSDSDGRPDRGEDEIRDWAREQCSGCVRGILLAGQCGRECSYLPEHVRLIRQKHEGIGGRQFNDSSRRNGSAKIVLPSGVHGAHGRILLA